MTTGFADLDALLERFVEEVQAILGDNLVGVYLQGSFALGDADVHSDVDFVAVTDAELSEVEQERIRELHRRVYEFDTDWAKHLEGSYVSRVRLRRADPDRTPLFYLDNGATELVWDPHCNTAVVRQTLREYGVVLAGPDPATLIEPVEMSDLQAEARRAAVEYAEWASTPSGAGGMSRWKQPYLVITFCRILQTIATGRIESKRQAAEWALRWLEPRWRPLIRRAIDDRPDPWKRVEQPAAPDVAAETLAFVDYAAAEALRG